MILGKFPAALFPIVGTVSAMISIVVCYYIAVKNGHEQPWPHCYISNTARHYPEFIYFRIGTISAAVCIILTYFVNYFWLKTICKQSIFRLHRYYPKVPLVIGIMGTFYLFGSTATIDTGIMNMKLHVHCAGMFFILTIISCLYNTVICVAVYRQTKKITNFSIGVKLLLSGLLIYQFYLEQFVADGFLSRNNSNLSHILQYTLAFTLLFYILLVAYDVKDFKMAYKCVTKQSSRQ